MDSQIKNILFNRYIIKNNQIYNIHRNKYCRIYDNGTVRLYDDENKKAKNIKVEEVFRLLDRKKIEKPRNLLTNFMGFTMTCLPIWK